MPFALTIKTVEILRKQNQRIRLVWVGRDLIDHLIDGRFVAWMSSKGVPPSIWFDPGLQFLRIDSSFIP